jgi:hypothetical protein
LGGLVAKLVVETFPELAGYVTINKGLSAALDSGGVLVSLLDGPVYRGVAEVERRECVYNKCVGVRCVSERGWELVI